MHCFSAKFIIALLAVAWTGAASAVEELSFKTRDGREFKNVFVTRTIGRKVEIMTPTGLQVVHVADLPIILQDRYLDPNLRYPPKPGDQLDFTAIDGHHYKGVLHRIAPDGISMETEDGLEKIAYSSLPVELGNNFDYDADDAARYQATIKAEQRRASAAVQAADRKAALQRALEEKAEADATAKALQAARNAQAKTSAAPRGTPNPLGAPQLGGRGLGNK